MSYILIEEVSESKYLVTEITDGDSISEMGPFSNLTEALKSIESLSFKFISLDK